MNAPSSHVYDGRKLDTVQVSSNSGIYQQSVVYSCNNRGPTVGRNDVQPQAVCDGPRGQSPAGGLSALLSPASTLHRDGGAGRWEHLFCASRHTGPYWQRPWLDPAGRKGLSSWFWCFHSSFCHKAASRYLPRRECCPPAAGALLASPAGGASVSFSATHLTTLPPTPPPPQ